VWTGATTTDTLRVRVEIMGSQQCRNVGKYQSVLIHDQSRINAIACRTR
jgi:hypothetical protein